VVYISPINVGNQLKISFCNATEFIIMYIIVWQDRLVCVATHYGPDGSEDRIPVGQVYAHPTRPALGPTQPTIRGLLGLSLEDKVAMAWL
jgi:hypothetical protein